MIDYHLIKEIEQNPSQSQRSLAQKLNISLGKVNYLLSGLVEKGIVKIRRLKDDPDKIRWQYILTPEGIKEKIKITQIYLKNRVVEYEKIQKEIENLKKEVDSVPEILKRDQEII